MSWRPSVLPIRCTSSAAMIGVSPRRARSGGISMLKRSSVLKSLDLVPRWATSDAGWSEVASTRSLPVNECISERASRSAQ